MIKLCIGLGQEHLEGVLWHSDTEAILTYLHEPNMIAVTHYLTVAMVWWVSPSGFASYPKDRQMRVWDLDDDQLWEPLEALQTEMAQRVGVASPLGLPWGNPQVCWGGSNTEIDDGGVEP